MEQFKNNGIEIITLPIEKWYEYRDIRLKALKNNSQAFLSPYKKESLYSDTKWKQRLQSAKKGTNSLMYFARQDNTLVGMIGSYRNKDDLKNHSAQIWGVYVEPEQRGKGIAKALMSTLINKLSKNVEIITVKLNVNIDQEHAKKLYEHFGFKSFDTISQVLGDGVAHQVTSMQKSLLKK